MLKLDESTGINMVNVYSSIDIEVNDMYFIFKNIISNWYHMALK